MSCNEIRENISLYIDGMLATEESAQVEQHLACCSCCKTEYEALKLCILQMKTISQVCLPDDFDQRLHQGLLAAKAEDAAQEPLARQQAAAKRGFWGKRKLWKQISGVAAVFVIGIFSYAMYNHMESPMLGGGYGLDPTDEGASKLYAIINQENEFTAEPFDASVEEENTTSDQQAPLSGEANQENQSISAEDFEAKESEEIVNNAPLMQSDAFSAGAQEGVSESDSDTNPGESSRHLYGISKENTKLPEEFIKEHSAQNPRDLIAVAHYANCIEKELEGLDFTIEECKREQDGSWYFRVHINTVGEYGEPLVEELIYTGQEGRIWIKELSLLTETAY